MSDNGKTLEALVAEVKELRAQVRRSLVDGPAPAAPPAAAPYAPPAPQAAADIPRTPSGFPIDPKLITENAVARMTPEQAVDWWKAFKRQSGQFVHPFAQQKQQASQESALIDALRQLARGRR